MSPSVSCVSSESSSADLHSHHAHHSDGSSKRALHQGLGQPAGYGRSANPAFATDLTGKIGSPAVNNDSNDHPYGLDSSHNSAHSYLGEYTSSSSAVEARGELPVEARWGPPSLEGTHPTRLHRPHSDHASHMYTISPSEMDMRSQVWDQPYYTGSSSGSGSRALYSAPNFTMTSLDHQQPQSSARHAPPPHFQTVHAPEFTPASSSSNPYRAQHPQPSVVPVPPSVSRSSPHSHLGPARRNAVHELPPETFDMMSANPSAWPPAGGSGYQSGHNIHGPPYHHNYPRSD